MNLLQSKNLKFRTISNSEWLDVAFSHTQNFWNYFRNWESLP